MRRLLKFVAKLLFASVLVLALVKGGQWAARHFKLLQPPSLDSWDPTDRVEHRGICLSDRGRLVGVGHEQPVLVSIYRRRGLERSRRHADGGARSELSQPARLLHQRMRAT